jgi:hypothetical protein
MIVDGRVIAFRARSSALRPIKEMLNRAGRLSVRYPVEVNGKVENRLFHGPLVSKWRMSTFEHREGFRYWTPLPTLLGKARRTGRTQFRRVSLRPAGPRKLQAERAPGQRVTLDRAAARPAAATPKRRQAGIHNRPTAASCAAA